MSEIRGTRRKARESALAYLYQTDLEVSPVTDDPKKFMRHFGVTAEAEEFFLRLILGVKEQRREIDAKIEDAADNWKLYRLEAVDRSILRMSTWELLSCPETDFQVVIDEAIELAKEFGSENSPSFVNGILDKIAKK